MVPITVMPTQAIVEQGGMDLSVVTFINCSLIPRLPPPRRRESENVATSVGSWHCFLGGSRLGTPLMGAFLCIELINKSRNVPVTPNNTIYINTFDSMRSIRRKQRHSNCRPYLELPVLLDR